MTAQLPDQSVYTGFVPKGLYTDFLNNKSHYDSLGRSYPYHYYQFYGIPYKVSYGDPYTLIDYVDSATTKYDPAIGIPGVPSGIIVVGNLTPPSPDMVQGGFGTAPPSTDMVQGGFGTAPPNKPASTTTNGLWAMLAIAASMFWLRPKRRGKRR